MTPSKLETALALMERLSRKNQRLEQERSEPIAVVGLACRLPGGAVDAESLGALLDEGRDGVRPLEARWALVGERPGPRSPRWAGLIDDITAFGAERFGISPREARTLDPQHRLILELCWEALEDAGVAPPSLAGRSVGVFVGACVSDHGALIAELPPERQELSCTTGNLLSAAAGRVNHTLGLTGPALTVDTACSSSLVAVHLAMASLRARECDLALVGGVNAILSPVTMEALAITGALSPEGRCRTFDALANGYVRGEGCGIVALQRQSDAERDRATPWALLRGSAVNHDGRATGLSAPNVLAQAALVRAALKAAGLKPEDVDVIEAHGTGTPLGDPIEVDALREVFRSARPDGAPLTLGAFKAQIGHLEGAAGVAGLLKLLVCLRDERVPANLNYRTLNPRIRLDGTPIQVAASPRPWPRGARPRVAGLSSFGLSGTNAHLVLSEAPPAEVQETAPAPWIFVLSASDAPCLEEAARRLVTWLERHPDAELGSVAWTLATGRAVGPHRLAVVAWDRLSLVQALQAAARGEIHPDLWRGVAQRAPRVALLFGGQGSQSLGMGRDLAERWRSFKEALDGVYALLDPGLRGVVWADPSPEAEARLDHTGAAQPALLAHEIALTRLWSSLGVEPAALLGHSVGEIAAAAAAGVLDVEGAARLVTARASAMASLPEGGLMAQVAASEAELRAAVQLTLGQLEIAAINGPQAVVLSGQGPAVRAALERLEARGHRTRTLRTSHAFHSSAMEPALPRLREALSNLPLSAPRIPLLSAATGGPEAGALQRVEGWVHQVRAPVRFHEAATQLPALSATAALEIGSRPALFAAMPACAPTQAPCRRAGHGEVDGVLSALAALFVAGLDPRWEAVYPQGGQRLHLPLSPLTRRACWVDPAERTRRAGEPLPPPPESGWISEPLDLATEQRIFPVSLDVARTRWLDDHRLYGAAVVPAVAWLMMAADAGARLFGADRAIALRRVQILAATVLPETGARAAQLIVEPDGSDGGTFRIAVRDDASTWTTVCAGELRARPAEAPLPPPARPPEAPTDPAPLYEAMATRGFRYGPLCRPIRGLWRTPEGALGEVAPPPDSSGHRLHPCLLEGALQVIAAAAADLPLGDDVYAPVSIDELVVERPSAGPLWSQARASVSPEPDRFVGEAQIYDGRGLVVSARGLTAARAPASALLGLAMGGAARGIYRVGWRALPGVAARRRGPWAVIAAPGAEGEAVVQALRARGESAQIVTGAAFVQHSLIEYPLISRLVWLAGDHEAAEARLEGLLEIMGAVAVASRPVRLHLLTRGAVGLNEGEPVDPDQRAVWGLARSFSNEHPDRWGGLLDGGSPEAVAEALLADDGEDQVALRGETRWAARLERAPLAPARSFRAEGTWLITGGLGALGLRVGLWLAQLGAARIALVSRHPPRDRSDPWFERISHAGASLRVLSADVSDEAELRAVFEALDDGGPPLRGLVHAAGVLDDGVLIRQDRHRLGRVLAPKVAGARNLHRLSEGLALDHFILFGSASATLGPPGQGPYAAANAWLEGLAAHRRAQGLPGLCVGWGPWSGGGMAEGAAAERLGLEPLAPQRALAALSRLMLGTEANALVAPIHWETLASALGSHRPRIIADQLAGLSQPAPTEHRARLLALDPEARAEAVLQHVLESLAAVLRAPEPPSPDASLFELGLDSIMALELRRAVAPLLAPGQELGPSLLYEHPTARALSRHLAAAMGPPPAPAADALDEDELLKLVAATYALSVDEVMAMVAGGPAEGRPEAR